MCALVRVCVFVSQKESKIKQIFDGYIRNVLLYQIILKYSAIVFREEQWMNKNIKKTIKTIFKKEFTQTYIKPDQYHSIILKIITQLNYLIEHL